MSPAGRSASSRHGALVLVPAPRACDSQGAAAPPPRREGPPPWGVWYRFNGVLGRRKKAYSQDALTGGTELPPDGCLHS